MKMKQWIGLLLALAMVFSLAACGQDTKTTGADKPQLSLDEMQEKIDKQLDKLNAVTDEHNELWNRLFEQEDDTVRQTSDDSIISTYLNTLLKKYDNLITEKERKTLTADIEKICVIEAELKTLQKEYSKMLEANGITDENPAPETFPVFEGKDLDGNAVNSAELFAGNKVTVVNFWFSGCAPCVGELGELNALNEQLKEKGGAVVGINTDTLDGKQEMIDEARQILERKGASYQNIWFDSSSEAGKFAGQVIGFPTTYIVDSNGKIMGQPLMGAIDYPGMMELLQAQINEALGEDEVFDEKTSGSAQN